VLTISKEPEGYLNIPQAYPADLSQVKSLPQLTINNFQKRLVHQLVRNEYPLLVSIGRPTFIQIIAYDKYREESFQKEKIKRVQERVSRQTGFRWVVEGMVGGNLSNIDRVMSSSAAVDGEALVKSSGDLQTRLKSTRPVLVGHNLFTDLVNFYQCFIGNLPDRIEEFQEVIHALFPVVIDTKYMATCNSGSAQPSSSLTEINEDLMGMKNPKICQLLFTEI
jgi:poly(A)-specific ribonuclease